MARTGDSKLVWRVLFWSAVAVLSVNFGKLAYQGLTPHKVRAASGDPYTVLRTESGFDKAGTLRYTNQYIEAVRADGSNMWKATTSLVQQRRIYFANGEKVLTNELLGKKSTYPKQFASIPARRPEASCLSPSDLKVGWVLDGTDSVGGYRTARVMFKGSKRIMTAWHALDAGCALLQLRLEHEDGLTVQNLSSLVFGEPDPTLFQVPANFQETPPSGLYPPICSGGGSCTSLPEAVMQRRDNNYHALRAATPSK
jgi:hypothetical protein